MIYTFYSYKGGVGRTMALANIAELFYREGLKVLMIDWDLEAPGLERFFFSEEDLSKILSNEGIIDMILGYKQQMAQKLDIPKSGELPFTKPAQYAFDIYPQTKNSKRALQLITAGKRTRSHFSSYSKAVISFDWNDFYETWQGGAYLEWVRQELNRMADVVLIDSRTGVTEMGGVCTYHLADAVILFCAANKQNIDGTLKMTKNFSNPQLLELRKNRPLKTLVVPARIEKTSALSALNQFRQRLNSLSDELKQNPELFEELEIPYFPEYAFEEIIAVKQPENSEQYAPELTEAYDRIFQELKRFAPKSILKKIAKIEGKAENKGFKRVLILPVNPHENSLLRLNEEVREIEEGLLRSKNRDQFSIHSRLVASLRGLRRALLDHQPQIVHFSGHGEVNGLTFEDERGKPMLVKAEALAGLFKLCPQLECVLLNGCYLASQAQAIQGHVPYVIGISRAIQDKASLEFSIGFYDALGAGESFVSAFKFGCNALNLSSLPEPAIPVLNGQRIPIGVRSEKQEQPEQIGFVNRINELQFITNMYSPPFILISSPAGYGKTALLKQISVHLAEQNYLCLNLTPLHSADPQNEDESIRELSLQIFQKLGIEHSRELDLRTPEKAGYQIANAMLQHISEKAPPMILLMLDQAETFDEGTVKILLNQWLPTMQEVFSSTVPPIRFRVIFAGRHISFWHQTSSKLPLLLHSLSPFDFSAVYQMVENFDKTANVKRFTDYKSAFAAYLMDFSGGHPGCMANILRRDFGSPLLMVASTAKNVYQKEICPVIEDIERSISSELRDIFDVLSVVRYFNPRLLRRFIELDLISWSTSEYDLETTLLQSHLIIKDGGFLKDDISRRLLAIRLRHKELPSFLEICKQAVSFYREQLQQSAPHRPDRITVELLFQYLQLFYYRDECIEKQKIFALLHEILQLLLSQRSNPQAEIDSVLDILKDDWEFRFTFNYLLRDGIYDNDRPFDEFIEQIELFRRTIVPGGAHD